MIQDSDTTRSPLKMEKMGCRWPAHCCFLLPVNETQREARAHVGPVLLHCMFADLRNRAKFGNVHQGFSSVMKYTAMCGCLKLLNAL